ncbi:hypothetical protein ACSBR1_021830 [Camellia fascicularis]
MKGYKTDQIAAFHSVGEVISGVLSSSSFSISLFLFVCVGLEWKGKKESKKGKEKKRSNDVVSEIEPFGANEFRATKHFPYYYLVKCCLIIH